MPHFYQMCGINHRSCQNGVESGAVFGLWYIRKSKHEKFWPVILIYPAFSIYDDVHGMFDSLLIRRLIRNSISLLRYRDNPMKWHISWTLCRISEMRWSRCLKSFLLSMLIPPFYTDFGKFSTGLWHAVFIIQALASSDISTGLPERFSLNKAASKPPALYLLMHKRTVFLLTSSFSEKVGYYHGNSDTIRQNSILSRKSLYSQANPIYKYGNCLYDQGNLFNGSFLFAIPEK